MTKRLPQFGFQADRRDCAGRTTWWITARDEEQARKRFAQELYQGHPFININFIGKSVS